MPALNETPEFALDDKYTQAQGQVLLSGIQALVRALQTRAVLDRDAGRNSGGFISGYRGSPLGGLDQTLWQEEPRLLDLGIKFQPGINEDLAATAVWGTQQVGLHEGATVDGVFALWYGKAPGLDRSCDAIRHANMWGTAAQGGVVMVVGDDPAAKSSSLASQSEFTLQDLMVPILSPANVQDVHDYTVLGWQMSRHSGLWVGLKAIADHMDSSTSIEVGTEYFNREYASKLATQALPALPALPALTEETTGLYGAQSGDAAPHNAGLENPYIRQVDTPAEQELRMQNLKLPRAIEFAEAAGINRWITKPDRSTETANINSVENNQQRLGIIAAGKAYSDIREALGLLGLHNAKHIRDAGIELLKLGMTWPLEAGLVQRFAQAVDKIWVVEEKRAFVEPQVKSALYNAASMLYSTDSRDDNSDNKSKNKFVPVIGKYDEHGKPLLSACGLLEVSQLVEVICSQLDSSVKIEKPQLLAASKRAARAVLAAAAPAKLERAPLFCAGCPHSTSTRVPQGSRATAGIGCHYMVQWMSRETDSCTHMGGEGVTWVGESQFTNEKHIFSNSR